MNEQELQDKLRAALDERAQGLDGATLSRLRQARARALEQPAAPWWQLSTPQWLGAAGSMAAVALVAVLVGRTPLPEPAAPLEVPLNHLEIATLEEELELIEDIDFYQWLDSQELAEAPADRSAQTHSTGSRDLV